MTTLYIECGRYYVGKSENVIARYQQHLDGKGSAWTKKHKPIRLKKTIDNASPFDEDNYTKQYMVLHGIDKVRGGSYANVTLTREILGADDKC
jgi:type VI protein secretion system component Hcp